MRENLKLCEGLIIASPEYAHGISGPLKNTLDWLVSGEEFPNKPIMIINTSPRASIALESLREVLTTMSGTIIHNSCVAVQLLGSELDFTGIVEDPVISRALLIGLKDFRSEIENLKLNTQLCWSGRKLR